MATDKLRELARKNGWRWADDDPIDLGGGGGGVRQDIDGCCYLLSEGAGDLSKMAKQGASQAALLRQVELVIVRANGLAKRLRMG